MGDSSDLFPQKKSNFSQSFQGLTLLSYIKFSVLFTDNRCVELVCCLGLWLIYLRGRKAHKKICALTKLRSPPSAKILMNIWAWRHPAMFSTLPCQANSRVTLQQ